MWFKTFNRQAWTYRLFRGRNLKFDNNSYGYFRFGYSSKFKNLLYKTIGNEGGVRFFAWGVLFPLIGAYSYISEVLDGGKTAALAKEKNDLLEIEMNKQIEEEMYKNR